MTLFITRLSDRLPSPISSLEELDIIVTVWKLSQRIDESAKVQSMIHVQFDEFDEITNVSRTDHVEKLGGPTSFTEPIVIVTMIKEYIRSHILDDLSRKSQSIYLLIRMYTILYMQLPRIQSQLVGIRGALYTERPSSEGRFRHQRYQRNI